MSKFEVLPDLEFEQRTSLQGKILARYLDLENLLGKPHPFDNFKISGMWAIINAKTGKIVTIYDFKETSLFDESLPSVEDFRRHYAIVEFNIGAECESDAADGIAWLQKHGIA